MCYLCYFESLDAYRALVRGHPRKYECVQNHKADQMLHQRLSKYFREHCTDSSQIKQFVRAPEHAERKSIIDLILDQNPAVCRLLPVEVLRELSLLWIAVLISYYDSAELLVRSGADVDGLFGPHHPQVIDANWSILHMLLHMDPTLENERLICLVADHGADLQAQDSKGRTVLQLAVTEGRVQMTKMLLENRAKVNVADDQGMSPLIVASSSSKADELVPLLIQHEADLQAVDSRGQTALHYAVTKCQVQLIEMFLEKGASPNAVNCQGVTPLHEAAGSHKADELVPLLMKHGADVNARDKAGRSVLYRLSDAPVEYVDLARDLLLDKGLSLEAKDCNLYQPIHRATLAGHNNLVKLYLDHGANVNSLAYGKDTPLHLAASGYNNAAVLKTLLERGAEVDRQMSLKGRTALHEACLGYNNSENIKILLAGGANVLIEDYDGKTPFAILASRRYNTTVCIRLLSKKLAVIKVCQPWLELKDERIIENEPIFWNYYRECIEQIERMKFARITETCTFIELLAKCHCQIAALMRNPEFEVRFRLYDLKRSEFAAYEEYVVGAFERAKKHYLSILDQEGVIDEAVRGIFPHLVVRGVAHYILDCCKNVSRV